MKFPVTPVNPVLPNWVQLVKSPDSKLPLATRLGDACAALANSANPAITLARSLSDTFAGIAPSSVAGFVLAQFAGAVAAHFTVRALFD